MRMLCHIYNLCVTTLALLLPFDNKYLLLGDFNLPTINWDILQGETLISNFFCDLVFNLNLVQMINEPTHIYGSILDLVLTTNDDNISSLLVHSYASLPIISDHFAITFSLNASLPSSQKFLPFYALNYFNGDYEGLNNYLSSFDFSSCFQSHTIEFIWSYIESTLVNAINRFIPQITIHNNHQPKWFTPKIRHHIKCVRTLRQKHKHNSTDHHSRAIYTPL